MTPQEEASVTAWGRHLDTSIPLGIVSKNDRQGRALRSFCEDLQQLVPAVRVEEEVNDEKQTAEIRLRPNISYHAVPSGRELEPFLMALYSPRPLSEALPSSIRVDVRGLQIPAKLKVYMTLQCAYCPQTVSQCLALADASPLIHVIVIDGILFPGQAEADEVHSVPCTILDDHFRWTGDLQPGELVDMILHRDPANLSADTLKSMVHEGRARDLARMMAERKEVFPAFLELLVHSKWPVRLGAMVTFEYLAETQKTLAAQMIAPLWRRFPTMDDPVKGDILFLFGELRDPSVIPMLQTVIDGDYPREVRESAREALGVFSREPD